MKHRNLLLLVSALYKNIAGVVETSVSSGTVTRTISNQTKATAMDKSPSFTTFPQRELHEEFFRKCFNLVLKEAIFDGLSRENPVLRFQLPDDLTKSIDLKLGAEPAATQTDLLHQMQQVIKYSVKTGHPYFANQLYSGLDPYGLMGEWLSSALNPSLYTYEVAPVFTLMEMEVFERMREFAGYPKKQGEGLFCPGGSLANGYAFSAARYSKFPETKVKGLFGLKPLVMYVSEDAHYSMQKLASFEGIGIENVVGVKVDDKGKMNIDDLKAQIKSSMDKSHQPFLVCGTAGTTVLGAFDPLAEIAEVCKEHDLWFHVDAAWGGGALMSKTHRHLLNGIEKSDSLTWNPHKLLCAPQQCSVLLMKNGYTVSKAHSTEAKYLFQKDKFYDAASYDTGDKHIQCGRRADVLKFWLMWKAKGSKGFESHIDHVFKIAQYAKEQIKARDGKFKLILENPECTNVSFFFIPKSLRGKDPTSSEFTEKIHPIAPQIKRQMMEQGAMMISYQPLRHHPNFFRLVIQNSGVTTTDIDYFLDKIEAFGENL